MRYLAKLVQKNRPKEELFLSKNGFKKYLPSKWSKNIGGVVTIFCEIDKEKAQFTANFEITRPSGFEKKGMISVQPVSLTDIDSGLQSIVGKLEEKYER